MWNNLWGWCWTYVIHQRKTKFSVLLKVWSRGLRPNYMNKGSETSHQRMQRLNDCLICPVTLKMWDVIKILYLEKTKITIQVLQNMYRDKRSSRDCKPFQGNTRNTWWGSNNQNTPNHLVNCFICKGSHLTRECPNRTAFNAFQATLASDLDDKLSQTKGEVGQIEEGENPRMGDLKILFVSLEEGRGDQ